MTTSEFQLVQACTRITEAAMNILHNCDYCEDQGMNVTDTRKAVQWLIEGAERDLKATNKKLLIELEKWARND